MSETKIEIKPMSERTKEELIARFKEMLEEMPQYSIYDITLSGDAASEDDTLTIIDKYHRELVEMSDGSYETEDEEHNRLENYMQACKHK